MYERFYQEFCNEVHEAIGAYLLWRMMQQRAYREDRLLSALNRTPLSWIFIRHSLQVTTFMTLGRIFDVDPHGFSVDDLIKTCIKELDLFSKPRLRLRKMIDQKEGKEPEWLEEYLSAAYEPTEEDFKRLRGEIAKKRRIFEETYQPIRHKLFAHNDKGYLGRHDELWKQTNTDELESLLWFLHDLKETLFDTYMNGRPLELKERVPDLAFYEHDYFEMLNLVRDA